MNALDAFALLLIGGAAGAFAGFQLKRILDQ